MKLNNIKEKLFRMLTEDLDLGYVVDIVKKNLDFKSKMKMIMDIARKSENYDFIIFLIKMTAAISVFLPIISQLCSMKSLNIFKLNFQTFKQIPVLFVSIFPIIVIGRKNLIFKDGALKAIILILYYIVCIPITIVIFGLNIEKIGNEYEDVYFLVFAVNIMLLFTSHIVLIKYCVTDIILRKRKVKSSDVMITLMTYITLGISFGALYSVINIYYDGQAFHGMEGVNTTLYFYFKHIYFSFVTLTTLGYGDIYPLKFLGQFFVIIEALTGIFLLNFSLGITLSSGILSFQINQKDNEDKTEKADDLGEKDNE